MQINLLVVVKTGKKKQTKTSKQVITNKPSKQVSKNKASKQVSKNKASSEYSPFPDGLKSTNQFLIEAGSSD